MGPEAPRDRARLGRGLLFQSCLYLWTLLFLTLTLPLILFEGGKRFIGLYWSHGTLGLLSTITGLDSGIEKRDRIPAGPCIIAAQHQSAWDTIIFQSFLPRPLYVVKRELFYIPLVGWHLRCYGAIGIPRRKGHRAIVSMIREARWYRQKGREIIIIFPQGSRADPREKKPPQSGIVALYRGLELPVVPAVVNSGLFWPRRSLRIRPGKAIVRFAPPIPPGLSKAAFLKTLEERWNSHGAPLLRRDTA